MKAKEATPQPPRKPAVVIPLGKSVSAPLKRSRSLLAWARERWVLASAVACVALPTLVAALYLGLIASPRYSTEVKFAVRGQETPAMDMLGILGNFGGTSGMTADSYIVIDYVLGRGMIEDIKEHVDVRELFSRTSIDFFSRLWGDERIEDVIEYWKKMVTASFEPSTGIVRIEVTAYDPQETVKLATAITGAADRLINHLSTESRRDALKAATGEVERAEQRQRLLRAAMRKFREQEQIADPLRRAGFQQDMIEKSKSELARIDTEIQTARGFMKDDAPSIVVLKNQRSAIAKQLESLRSEVGGDGTTAKGPGGASRSVATMLATFEELEAERGFAEKAYVTALASLERARIEADRKQRYLAIFSRASTPENAKYPRVLRDTFMVAIAAGVIWAIAMFLIAGAREHA